MNNLDLFRTPSLDYRLQYLERTYEVWRNVPTQSNFSQFYHDLNALLGRAGDASPYPVEHPVVQQALPYLPAALTVLLNDTKVAHNVELQALRDLVLYRDNWRTLLDGQTQRLQLAALLLGTATNTPYDRFATQKLLQQWSGCAFSYQRASFREDVANALFGPAWTALVWPDLHEYNSQALLQSFLRENPPIVFYPQAQQANPLPDVSLSAPEPTDIH